MITQIRAELRPILAAITGLLDSFSFGEICKALTLVACKPC